MQAMGDGRYREQYTDAVGAYCATKKSPVSTFAPTAMRASTPMSAVLSWSFYPARHMAGFANIQPRLFDGRSVRAAPSWPRSPKSRVLPEIVGPVGAGDLQYSAIWRAAQRLTHKPVKFGTIAPELLAMQVVDRHYKDVRDRIMAFSEAFNAELLKLARAGCPAIQIEDPQVHMLAAKGIAGAITPEFSVEVFNRTVKGLRDLTEVWCHSCWGNAAQQRAFDEPQSYQPALEVMNKLDADVITFECCSNGGMDLVAISERITEAKIGIGVVDHHTLQVESPGQVAALIRRAIKHIEPQRLILCSDCGMGREGMSRRHAFFKMVSIVRGTNIVRKELGVPEAACLAAEESYILND